jgi:glycosyltransferase involved in cell wall biosynthesis
MSKKRKNQKRTGRMTKAQATEMAQKGQVVQRKKVGMFTTFFEDSSGYSLIAVAETQIGMLLRGSYDPVVLVQENFEASEDSLWRPEIIDIRPLIPALELTTGVAKDFKERVERILNALRDELKDVDVCITHDIILQEFYKEHNCAMREYSKERPDLLWLHWIHSCPRPRGTTTYPKNCRYQAPPGYIIYPNHSDLGQVCRTYRLQGQEWRAKTCRAGHAIDPLSWPYDKLTRDLVKRADLLSGKVVVVYPARLDRGKQPEKIIRLLAGVQQMNYEVRLLVIDWQSQGEHFQRYMDELLDLSSALGLQGKVNFTSRLDDRCSQGVPHRVVLELMQLSNVYVHPSRIETYSLVVHEAMLSGCLCVLNHDLTVMRELYGDNAIYMDFGSDYVSRDYGDDEQVHWNVEAGRLLAELTRGNRSAWAKTVARCEWSPDALWKEMEPLLYLQPVGEMT